MEETITTLRLEDVYPNPRHYREVMKANVDKIAASIAEAGQLVPIEVWPDGDIYYVDQGHHRLAAMKQLGHETIRAIVTDAASAVSMVASNLSIPETELEKSRGTQLMLETGIRPEAVAAHVGESAERIAKAAHGFSAGGERAEEWTIDRAIAVAEVEEMGGDADAVITASEKDWWRIANKARNLITYAETYERYLEVARASGVEMIEASDFNRMSYESSGEAAPKGAAFVRVTAPSDEGAYTIAPSIAWYKARESAADLDPEEAERQAKAREDAEMKQLALESAGKRRDAWLRDYLAGKHLHAGGDHLAAFIDRYWEDGNDASAGDLEDDFASGRPFIIRVRASLIVDVESYAQDVLKSIANGDTSSWFIDEHGGAVIEYFAALRAMGYDPTPLETDLIAKLEWARLDKEDDDE